MIQDGIRVFNRRWFGSPVATSGAAASSDDSGARLQIVTSHGRWDQHFDVS